MSKVANYISLSRLIGAGILLIVSPFSSIFYGVYLYCGISDIADGYIARKTNTISHKGAIIDSIADGTLFVVMFIIIYPIIELNQVMWTFIVLILALRVISIIVVYHKYKKVAMLHTYGNKATGLMVFLIPFMLALDFNHTFLIWIIGLIAFMSAIEELLIHVTSKFLNIDRKSILTKKIS